MSKPFDYSKWDKLDISDDEKEYHPNIDSSLMIRIKREQRARREAEEEKKRVLENNAVEDIQDLLDIKKQLMALESVNNMHVLTIAEKDERIRELTELLQKGGGAQGGAMS